VVLKRTEFVNAREKAAEMIQESGIFITPKEIDEMDVVDFGHSQLEVEGAQIVTFFNTSRVSAKVIALFPNQTEPEHWHIAVGEDPGKEETLRIISGTVRLYIPGDDTLSEGSIPKGKDEYYTVRHEVVMKQGDQITLQPGTKHWFQAGEVGAVMYTFSSCARDALDCFADPNIVRLTQIID